MGSSKIHAQAHDCRQMRGNRGYQSFRSIAKSAKTTMSLLKETEKLEEKVRLLIEGLFGKEAAREPLEIRRAILREIEGKIEPVGRNRRAFPFNRLRVHLFASDPNDERFSKRPLWRIIN